MSAMVPMDDPEHEPKVELMKRYFVMTPGETASTVFRTATRAPTRSVYQSRTSAGIAIGEMSEKEAEIVAKTGARVIPSRQYAPLFDLENVYHPLASHPKSLTDVLDHIRAPRAWKRSRGAEIDIAIIDTGICGKMSEFPAWKKSPHSLSTFKPAWKDPAGHGSMTAGIAAATSADGGRYDGVAPDARLIDCPTSFDATEIFQIYEHLIGLVADNEVKRIVTNNSYGKYTCQPEELEEDDPVVMIIRQAVQVGIVPVFAAGNNHVYICDHEPDDCGPNTIWGVNSMDEVLTVGTVDEDERMDRAPAGDFGHRDSSRGPGEMAKVLTKPDCVAPTYGEVIWGCGYQAMEWWGTSGAAPQVAGLAALILSREPDLTVEEIADRIRGACRDIGLAPTCSGRGIIDCEIAVP